MQSVHYWSGPCAALGLLRCSVGSGWCSSPDGSLWHRELTRVSQSHLERAGVNSARAWPETKALKPWVKNVRSHQNALRTPTAREGARLLPWEYSAPISICPRQTPHQMLFGGSRHLWRWVLGRCSCWYKNPVRCHCCFLEVHTSVVLEHNSCSDLLTGSLGDDAAGVCVG